MKRHETNTSGMIRLLASVAAICLGTCFDSHPAQADKAAPPPEGPHFASSPLLAQETDLDLEAAGLLSNPAVIAERKQGEQALRASLAHVSPSSLARYDQAMEELTFFGLLNGLNDDPTHPNITIVGRPGRTLSGQYTPAPKGLDENPDSVYRIIPMDGTSTYVLRGKVAAHRPQINEFSLLDDAWVTIGNLSKDALKIDPDGSFTITVGPEAAGDRPNYIRTKPGASYMTIRDTVADWPAQRPNALTVERVAGPPAQPLSETQRLQNAVAKVKRYFSETIKLHDLALKQPANFFPQPKIRTTFGMLVTQAYSIGHFDLADGQALVLTIHPGTAKYATVPITDIWGTTGDPVHHQSSLNTLQADHNPDGTYTVVVAAKDPGVRNWVDTEGLSEGFIFLRWAGIEPDPTGAKPIAVDTKLVPLSALAAALPPSMKKIDAEQRRQQLLQRSSDYDLRWLGP